ncbi:MAG: hypothetical protein HYT87_12310 [Nitrospirae bacterium]|nr:hypothetical protein [Nitrospirota bacterium]
MFPVHLPPLRERKGDVGLLADLFLKHHAGVVGRKIRGLTDGARRRLEAYSWPGNVRELENVIERAVILCSGEYLTEAELRLGDASGEKAGGAMDVGDWISRGVPIDTVEKQMIERALEMSGGNQSEAAKLLGLTRSKLRSRLAKFNLG